MRYKALVLMLVMLLQPFAATAAIIAVADSSSSAISVSGDPSNSHCADQSQSGSTHDQTGHEHNDSADCLEECQVCMSCAGYVAADISTQSCAIPDICFLFENSADIPGQLFELLYRPPINS